MMSSFTSVRVYDPNENNEVLIIIKVVLSDYLNNNAINNY